MVTTLPPTFLVDHVSIMFRVQTQLFQITSLILIERHLPTAFFFLSSLHNCW